MRGIPVARDDTALRLTLDRRDVNYWMDSLMSCVLVLNVVAEEKAFWLDIQDQFRADRSE
jgi:hypothetical protein